MHMDNSEISWRKRGEGKNKMLNNGEEPSLVGEDNVSSTSDAEGRSVLEEELTWARLERQKVLTLSAEADEAIWNLAALARRTMQERDEARSQARMLLADLQTRNSQTMTLPGTPPCSRVAATGYGQALAPTVSRPIGNGNTPMQGQPYARTGTGYCAASSSGFGHVHQLASSLHGSASSSQDHFDPDMFLVDAAESPQDAVPAAAGSSQGKGSGTYGQIAEQRPLQWKGKSAQVAGRRGR